MNPEQLCFVWFQLTHNQPILPLPSQMEEGNFHVACIFDDTILQLTFVSSFIQMLNTMGVGIKPCRILQVSFHMAEQKKPPLLFSETTPSR